MQQRQVLTAPSLTGFGSPRRRRRRSLVLNCLETQLQEMQHTSPKHEPNTAPQSTIQRAHDLLPLGPSQSAVALLSASQNIAAQSIV